MPITPQLAGMPTPLWVLNNLAEQRVEAISFFGLVVLLSAAVVRTIWNRAAVEAFGWPRIGYGRALGVVALWGCAFVLVLTMISGARELMTPGAWRVDGATYSLDSERLAEERQLEVARRDRITAIGTALERRTRTDGLSDRTRPAGIDWAVPGRPGVEYVYRGAEVDSTDDVLVAEPRVFGEERFVLRADGRVERTTHAALVREWETTDD